MRGRVLIQFGRNVTLSVDIRLHGDLRHLIFVQIHLRQIIKIFVFKFCFLAFKHPVLLCVQCVQILGITATLILFFYSVALERCNLKVNTAKFNDVAHAESRCLQLGAKVL